MTDDEFVERIRRQTQRTRTGLKIFAVVLGMIWMGLAGFIFWQMQKIKGAMVDGSAYHLGLFLGATWGGMFIFGFSALLNACTLAFLPRLRQHRLLVKYYDAAAKPAPGNLTVLAVIRSL